MSFWANVVGVTFTIEAAFGYAWNATPTWTDITSHVRSVQINRGKSDEFGDFGPGTATITLNNRGRLFDPAYTAGTYYGDLTPMVPVRVMADTGSGDVSLYRGFITGWPQRYVPPNEAVAVVPCVDASRFLEQSLLPASAYAYEVLEDSPVAYWPLQSADADGRVTDVVAGRTLAPFTNQFTSAQTLRGPSFTDIGVPLGQPNAVTTSVPTTGYNQVSLTNDFDSDTIAAPKAIEFYVRNTGDGALGGGQVLGVIARKNTTNYLAATFSYDTGQLGVVYGNSTDAKYKSLTQVTPLLQAEGLHHVALWADTSNLYVLLNGVQIYSTSLTAGTPPSLTSNDIAGVTVTVQAGEDDDNTPAISHFAWYSTAPTTARFLAHYHAGLVAYGYPTGERAGARIGRILNAIDWPSGERSLSTGKTRLGPYLSANRSAMEAMREVAAAERGLLFVGKDGKVVLRDRNYRLTNLPLSGGAGVNLLTEDGEALLTEDGENLITEGEGAVTFTDSTAGERYSDVVIDGNTVEALRNSVVATFDGGTVRLEDATSIAAYGRATESVDLSLVERRRTAEKLSAFVLRTSKDPQTRVTQLVVTVRRDATSLAPLMSTIELGDTLIVERTPQGVGTALSERVTVQGINHDIQPDRWTTTLYLSPALDTYDVAPYLVAGDATYGKVGATAGNLIPA